MKNILLPAALLLTAIANGQYYYNDIIGTAEIVARQKIYLANKVQLITAVGFDDLLNVKTDEFNEWHEVKDNGRTLMVTTTNKISQTQSTKTYVIYRFDTQGRVASLTDSSEGVAAVAKYVYDANNNLISITNVARNPMTGEETTELHKWFYNSSNKPTRLFRILDGKDTTDYSFKTDANGNVIEEQGYRKSFPIGDPTLYYYDDLNRLTDIVKFNPHANRLLPDFMFEYNSANQVLQKTSTISTMREPAPLPRGQMPKEGEVYKGKGASLRLSYLAWRYTYDEKGLKIRETLYGKDKTKIGHIEFDYSFGQ